MLKNDTINLINVDEILEKVITNYEEKSICKEEQLLINEIRQFIPYDKIDDFDKVIKLSKLKNKNLSEYIFRQGVKLGIQFIIDAIKQD